MTGWKRYLLAVLGGLVGSVLWGALMVLLGASGYAVIGAVVIMIGALAWAHEG